MMEKTEEEKHVEPGAARYGNFPDYYRFNPAHERMKYLREITEGSLHHLSGYGVVECLDIGCNTGELTVQLNDWCKSILSDDITVRMRGVDIDPKLIECAISKYQSSHPNVEFICSNVMTDGLPLQESEEVPKIIFCFSVTLWIHLNHGDDGLRTFLRMLAESCDYLIIEPQPWKCYRTAVRRAKRANQQPFEHYDKLEIRGNVTEFISSYLTETCKMTKIVHAGTTQWDREICLFSKR